LCSGPAFCSGLCFGRVLFWFGSLAQNVTCWQRVIFRHPRFSAVYPSFDRDERILVNIGITQETRQRRKPEEPTQGARPGNAGTKIVQSSKPDKATQEAAPGNARSQTRQRRKLDQPMEETRPSNVGSLTRK
jgi:hypothetical protein